MREKVWINRIRIAVGLFLAVGIFINNRELTPGWIAFLLALIGLGELAAAPGVKSKNAEETDKQDKGVAQPDPPSEADTPSVPVSRPRHRGGSKSFRLSL